MFPDNTNEDVAIEKQIVINLKATITPEMVDTMVRKMIQVLNVDELLQIEGFRQTTTLSEITINAQDEKYMRAIEKLKAKSQELLEPINMGEHYNCAVCNCSWETYYKAKVCLHER